ncbi:CAP domain-containing protein, partial [Mycoplasmoides pneumoniae]|uniref:CAP domain-containing protein n=1 Tax=Mycoplasmoides pneumoniae TaxID=2104 RepID=UPI003CFC5489
MKKVIVITIILALVAGVGGGVWLKTRLDAQAAAGVAQEQAESKYDVGPPDAQEMLELVNQERTKVGVAPLRLDERLNASAQEKADDMQNRDYYDHKSPDGIEGYSLVFKHMPNRCRYASENLAKVSTTDSKFGSSRFTIDNWMHSTKG